MTMDWPTFLQKAMKAFGVKGDVSDLRPGYSFSDLSEIPPDDAVPWLDRGKGVDEKILSLEQKQWRHQGVVIKERLISEELIANYEASRSHIPHVLGFPDAFAYMKIEALRAIACYKPLADLMTSLLGEEMLPHFDLTQWVSTERNWHQDDYLNEEHVNSHYAAVWFALDKIHPDCGPFQYIPGSNRWPVLRQKYIKARMDPEKAAAWEWPKYSEEIVTPAFEEKVAKSKIQPKYFLGNRGDTLIWHGRLVHRGTTPNIPQMIRKSLIVHYTGISKLTPELHEIHRTPDGVPYIWHKNASASY